MWPSNTADVTALLPVVDRLRQRFGVGRVCVVADRGMVSADTIMALDLLSIPSAWPPMPVSIACTSCQPTPSYTSSRSLQYQ